MITIIAAITRDRALGRGGDMLYHISADLRRFKSLTLGHPIVMGRKTFESFPNGALPGRRNIVVSRSPEYSPSGAEVFATLDDALDEALRADEEVFVLGGGKVYAQTIGRASRLIITQIDADSQDADTFFPEISEEEWEVDTIGEWQTDPRSGVKFRYVDYRRRE